MSSEEMQAGPSAGGCVGHGNGGGVGAQSTDQESALDRKLRALLRQMSIDSTASLVRAYNGTATEQLLHKCLRIYSEKKWQYVNPDTVMEYVELCKMKPRTDDDKEILGEVVSVLTGRIPDGEFAVESVAEALYRSLLWTPPALFQEDVTKLVALADKLTASLHPTPRLTKTNFLAHEATFKALHEVFVLMQRTAREKVIMEEKKRFQSNLKAKRSSMGDSCKYYPVQYYFRLIEQSIQRLELDEEPAPTAEAVKCLICTGWGLLHIVYTARRMATGIFSPFDLRLQLSELRQLMDSREPAERQWYDLLQALCFAGRESVEDHQKLEIFEEGYKTVEAAVWKMRRCNKDGKALLFGLIQELRHLALSEGSGEVRRSGSSKLFALAETISTSAWVKDKDIVEALLGSLHAFHSTGDDTAAALQSMQLIVSVDTPTVKRAVRDWLGGMSFEAKLGEAVRRPPEPSGDLFCAIGREFNHIPLHEARNNVEQLKNRYRSDKFAKVKKTAV